MKSVDTTLEEVCRLSKMTEEGTSMLNLLEAGKTLGLAPRPVKTRLKKLRSFSKSSYAIVHLKPSHFVLVVGWSEDGLIVVDPPRDAYVIGEKEFRGNWTGYALLFDRTRPEETASARMSAKTPGAESVAANKKTASFENQGTIGASAKQKPIPEMAQVLLSAIQRQKSSRADLRNLYALVNEPAPELDAGLWLNSSPVSLADLRGKIVVLEFSSIFCGGCPYGFDTLNEIRRKFDENRVAVTATIVSRESTAVR